MTLMGPRSARLALALLSTSLLARCAADVETVERTAEPIVVCARGETVEGVDVSEYQGRSIDWGAVHASGRQFAIARIGVPARHRRCSGPDCSTL